MKTITQKQLNRLLRKHKLYLKGYECGKHLDLSEANLSVADLSVADLRGTNLRGANLSVADLRGTNLRGAYLGGANLSRADLRGTNLRGAYLGGANLSRADLSVADLIGTNLRGADLSEVNLRGADLRGANLSEVKGLLSAIDYLEENFEKTSDGYIVYKKFNMYREIPSNWKIEKNFIIKENVDTDRCNDCSCGINAGTLEFIKNRITYKTTTIYKLLIKYEWLAGVVVPYNTEGNIRCERAMIMDKVKLN